MNYSPIQIAVLETLGQRTDAENATFLPLSLTNEQLSHEVAEVVTALDQIADVARYAADPRKTASDICRVLTAYFRTPDPEPAVAAAE